LISTAPAEVTGASRNVAATRAGNRKRPSMMSSQVFLD
jgi:hypothetical protein